MAVTTFYKNVSHRHAVLMGRCANGFESDHGSLVHVVNDQWRSICGYKPGRRSAGWAFDNDLLTVTCPKCLSKINKVKKHKFSNGSEKYHRGIDFIAFNDEPSDLDVISISTYISVGVLSEVFKIDEKKIAEDILHLRRTRREKDS